MKILNRYEQIYRHAGFKLLQASHDNVALGALNVMLKANEKIAETSVLLNVIEDTRDLKDHLGLSR